MDNTEHPDSMLVAEYALGLMGSAESKAFAKRLEEDAELYQEYLLWLEQLAPMASGLPLKQAPADVKAKIEKRLFGKARNNKKSGNPWFVFFEPKFITGLLVVGLLGFLLKQSLPPSFAPTHIAELASEDQSLAMTAKYDAAAGLLRVNTATGAPANGRDFELWVIAGDNPPASLGVLKTDSAQRIEVPTELVKTLIGSTLAISDEPLGGSPTGQPTGSVLATATVGAI